MLEKERLENKMAWLEIRLSKCRLYLTEAELRSLLAMDPELWAEAIRRGKGIQRSQTAAKRQAKISPHFRDPKSP